VEEIYPHPLTRLGAPQLITQINLILHNEIGASFKSFLVRSVMIHRVLTPAFAALANWRVLCAAWHNRCQFAKVRQDALVMLLIPALQDIPESLYAQSL